MKSSQVKELYYKGSDVVFIKLGNGSLKVNLTTNYTVHSKVNDNKNICSDKDYFNYFKITLEN